MLNFNFMNKHLILILLAASLFAFCSPERGNDRRAILKVLERQRQAWNKGDLEGYMQGYIRSDSLVFIGQNGPQYGWKTTLENYKKGYPDAAAMGFLTFDIKEVRILSRNYAFVIGGWHLRRENDEPKGSFTLLLERIGGEWKVVADHSS